jgi:transposase
METQSISPAQRLAELTQQQNQLHDDISTLQAQLASKYEELDKQKRLTKVVSAYQQNTEQSDSEEDAPRKRHKYEQITPEVKSLVCRNMLYNKSMTWEQCQRAYGISNASISRILKEEKQRVQQQQSGEQPSPKPPRKKRGRRATVSIDDLIFVALELENDSTLTLRELCDKLQTERKVDITESGLWRHLEKMDVTWKNVLPIPEVWNKPEIISERMRFVGSSLPTFAGRPTFYLDESGFDLHTRRGKGRSPSGEPATLTLVPKGHRISLVACLGLEGIVLYRLINSLGEKKRGVNADDFRSFLLDLAPKIDRNSVLILDNAKIHHSERLTATWAMLKATYGIDRLYLPPYSPFLNPIEYAFNALKTEVKSCTFRDKGQLIEAIEQKIPSITPEKANKFFRKSVAYWNQCALGLPFHGKPLEPDLNTHITPNENNNNNSNNQLMLPQA